MINFVIPAFRKTSIRVFHELVGILKANEHYSLLVLIDNPDGLAVEDFAVPPGLEQRIRIIRYRGNIGLAPNLLNSMVLADREWLWICGDDDDYRDFPSADIDRTVTEAAADVIKFSYRTLYSDRTSERHFPESQKTLDEIMAVGRHSDFDVGELIFTSNMLLRVSTFSRSFNEGFKWGGTLLAHLAVILHSNKHKPVTIKFSPIAAIGNNRYADISWGRLDLYHDLIVLSQARSLSVAHNRSAIRQYCRSYITTTKLGVQLAPLFTSRSSYQEQLDVLRQVARLSARLGKLHVAAIALGGTLLPLRACGRITAAILRALSRVDARFGRYASLIEKER